MYKVSRNDPTAPISVARIVDGDLYAHKFNEGWLVRRCITSELVPKRDTNWGSIASGVAAGPLASDGATAGAIPDMPWTLQAEGGGRKFIYSSFKNITIQVFAGINWPLARVFYENPKGTRQGRLNNTELGPPTLAATGISTWGWTWSGFQSMCNKITRASMALVPYDLDFAVAVFNAGSQPFTPIFDWQLNMIQGESLDPTDKDDAKLIEMVLKNRLDVIKYNPGLGGFNYTPGFKEIYGVEPVVQTKRQLLIRGDKARPIGGGD